MASESSHSRQRSSSSPSRSYSRPSSSVSVPPSLSAASSSSPASSTATTPSSSSTSHHSKRHARPRAGGIDFGQPLEEEKAAGAAQAGGGGLWGIPLSQGAGSFKAPGSQQVGQPMSLGISSSDGGPSTRIPQSDRQSPTALPPSASHNSLANVATPTSTASKRASQPPPARPILTTPTTASFHRAPITIQSSHPYASASSHRNSTASTSSYSSTNSYKPPNRTSSLSVASSKSLGSQPSSTTSPRTAFGTLTSPYTFYQPPSPVRSSSTASSSGVDEATVRQRRDRRPSYSESYANKTSSWASNGDDSSSLHSRSSIKREGGGAAGRSILESSDEDMENDLLNQQELRRPSWVSVRVPSITGLSGRSDSTTTITPTAGRRRYSSDHGSPLMDELPLPTSQMSRNASSPTTSFTSFASSQPGTSPSFATTPLFTASPSSPSPTLNRTGTRPPPIILPPSPRQQDKEAFETRAQDPNSLLSSPNVSPPILPARSPLRPRTGCVSPAPSHTSSSSGRRASHRTSYNFSRPTSPSGREYGNTGDADASQRRPQATRTASYQGGGDVTWSSRMGGTGRESYQSNGRQEVWLDKDGEAAAFTRRPTREENGWGEEARSASKGRDSDPMNSDGGGVSLRPTSTGSGFSARAKQKRREARLVTSMYAEDSSDSNGESPQRSRVTTYPPSLNLPSAAINRTPRPSVVQASLPFSNGTPGLLSSPSLGLRSPSCPAFSVLHEIPNEHLAIESLSLASASTVPLSDNPKVSTPLLSPGPHARSLSQPSASPLGEKPLPSPTPTTKRAHLLHEIHSTERSYANDLVLVREAYIQRLRPANAFTPGAVGESTSTPTSSNRNSMLINSDLAILEESERSRAPSTAGDRASKISSSSASSGGATGAFPTPSLFSLDAVRSPLISDAASMTSNSYFPLNATQHTAPSPKFVFSPGGGTATTGAAVLSTSDMRAVFLNVEALAALAEEFATVLETMAAQEEGEDMIGEAFLTMMPRIKQAYTLYCPRQSTANLRLVELLADPRYASSFAECWTLAQPHTKSWDLPSLLIKPVQRVLKYPLLLDDLLKCTPATHPDFNNLKDAAKLIKAVADEINEVKRRKDTVDRIIHGKHADVSSTSSSHLSSKDKNKRGVKMGFRKDKDRVSSASSSVHSAGTSAAAASQFGHEAHEKLRKTEGEYSVLVERLMVFETTAKKVGKIVAGSGTRARETWMAQRQVLERMRRMVNLGGMEPVEDIRIEAYREVVHTILEGPCQAMEQELRKSLIPNLVTLLNVCKGPRTVILKRNTKHEDYNRVVVSKNKGEWDRLSHETIEGAEIFIALHQQLLVELPALLEGFASILDHILAALGACHARFHQAVSAKLAKFWEEFPPVVADPEVGSAYLNSDGPAIIKVWEEASRTPTEMIESLAITRKIQVRVLEAPTLIASGSFAPNPHGIISRNPSAMSMRRTETTSSSGQRTSVASNSTASTISLPFESKNRARSSSNAARPSIHTPPSPIPGGDPKSGMFHFRSKSTKAPSKPERHGSHNLPTATSSLTPATTPSVSSRSQTLPAVSSGIHIPARPRGSNHYASSSTSSNGPALSALSFEGSDTNPDAFSESVARRLSRPSGEGEADDAGAEHGFRKREREGGIVDNTDLTFMSSNRGSTTTSFTSASNDEPPSPRSSIHPYAASSRTPTKASEQQRHNIEPPQVEIFGAPEDLLAGEGAESPTPTLYRCECVADFDLRGLNISYMNHDFLSIARGDEIDVVFEIGRVDELDNFPLDVGLEDDGLLIGRDCNGVQGFVLCSFLHPIDTSE